MSMIKDLLIILVFFTMLYLIVENVYLKKTLINQKKSFIQILGHDLKVAVIAQLRGLDLLLKYKGLSEDNLDLIKEISRSTHYTLDMLTMLIKIYELENNYIVLKYEKFDLSASITTILNEFNYKITEKNINLFFSTENNFINADKDIFVKALKFLVGTVIDYSKQGAQVEISVKKNGSGFILEISYNGRHINYDDYLRIFTNNSEYSTVGHGIQMLFCQKIINLHNGRISFSSGNNEKHCFRMFMPKLLLINKR